MKKVIFAVFALAFSASAFAESVPQGAPQASSDARIQQQPKVTEADSQNPDTMRKYLAPAEGGEPVYEAYLKNGYLPLHAMMLANWDITEALRQVSPGLPQNPQMKAQLEVLREQYKSVN
jgi:hypothetical protein